MIVDINKFHSCSENQHIYLLNKIRNYIKTIKKIIIYVESYNLFKYNL